MDQSLTSLDREIASTQLRIADLQESEQLAQAKTHMRALWTRRNSLTTIFRLPEEILLRVLELLVRSRYANLPDTESVFRPAGWAPLPHEQTTSWTRVMGVCTYMHAVAISCPSLWSYIDLDHRHSAWTQTCLDRAKPAPLFVHARSSLHRWFSTPVQIELLGSIMARTQDGTFVWGALPVDTTTSNAVQAMFDAPAPHLRTLAVSHSTSAVFVLSSKFLGGAPAMLTRLALEGVALSADPPTLPALIHLQVERMYVDDEIERLLLLTERAPELRTLRIGRIQHLSVFSGGLRRIALPRLATFTLATQHDVVAALLTALPASSSWKVLPSKWWGAPTPELRLDAFERALQRLKAANSGAPVVPQLLWEDKSESYSLTCQAPHMRYRDVSDDILDFGLILDVLPSLRGDGQALQALFDSAAANALPALRHLIIEGECGNMSGMIGWLETRVAAEQRIERIEFNQGVQPTLSGDFCPVTELALTLMAEELAGAVFIDGQKMMSW
jgi:hypothetical protein